MAEGMNMQGSFHSVEPEKDRMREGLLTPIADPLSISIEDDELVRIVDDRISNIRDFYSSHYDLYNRRKIMEMYYFGRQIIEQEREKLLKNYESRFQDNVLYEIMATFKPLAMSRIPDLIVLPGNDSDNAKLMAQEVSKAIDTEIKERNNRKVLGIATKHLPVYFTAVIKVRWNPEIDDYEFINVHPDLIDVDYTCPTNNAQDMKLIRQLVPITVEQMLLRFPDKTEEIYTELIKDGIQVQDNKPKWKQLATEVQMSEVWFTEYKRKSEKEVERIDGVLWKYHDCILKKMRNPNFDYEGEKKYFAYDDMTKPDTKRPLNDQETQFMALTGQPPPNVQEEQIYHNYFEYPVKPYFFFGYDQWNTQPYDETSWLEQNMYSQKNLDKRGKQIDETLDNRGHFIYSKESGLQPSDIEALDMADPDQDLVVDGIPDDVVKYIEPPRPTPQEFENLAQTRQKMMEAAGVNASQGNIQSDTATTNQIARESNFTRADDVVEDTVNAAAEWMAAYALQMIKLRYTKKHFRWVMGSAGDEVQVMLDQNKITDGMIVKIKASGTDKLKTQNQADEMAKMQMVDPYNFFRMKGLPDPEGLTQDLMDFKLNPQAYIARVCKGLQTPQEIEQALMQTPMPPMMPQQGQPPMNMPGQGLGQPAPQAPQPMQGQPQNPTMQNTAQVPAAPPQAPAGSPRVL